MKFITLSLNDKELELFEKMYKAESTEGEAFSNFIKRKLNIKVKKQYEKQGDK